jgi:hypothetical protein
MDIEASASTSSVSKGFISSQATHHILLLRMNIHDFGSLVFLDDGFRFKLTNITIADSDLQGAYAAPSGMWLNGKNIAVLGTKIKNSEGSEHIIRTSYADGGVYSNNDLSEQASKKSVIKLHSPRPQYGLITSKVVISDNKFAGGRNADTGRVLTVKASAACVPDRNNTMLDVIVERNFFESTVQTQNHVLVGGSSVTVRNNIFNMTLGGNQNGVIVEKCGGDPSPKDVAVVNNTFYSGSTGFTAVKLGIVNSNISATNNLVYAPNSNNTQLTTGAVNTQSNLLLNSNQFVSSSFAKPADFILKSTSAAVDAGDEHPSVVCEYEQRVRSNISAITDIGAFEQ